MDAATADAPGTLDSLVIGLGNILLGDDGVGVHAVRRLASEPGLPPGSRLLDGGTLGFRLLGAVTRATGVLFIDAAELGEPAGATRLLEHDALSRHVRRGGRISAHEAGLVDLLTLARLDGWRPTRLAVLAMQPERIDWDERLSIPVVRALPAACRMAVAKLLAWKATA